MFRLRCFGYPRLEGPDGRSLEAIQSHPKRFALLIYLSCQNETHPCQRESLFPVFWPGSDEARARNSLRQSLHVLRRILGEDPLRGRDDGVLSIDSRRILCDMESFRLARREGRWADALEVHIGDFLADFFLPGAGSFMDWVDLRRRAMRENATDCARRLARDAEAGKDAYQAVGWWTRALELAPYDEEVVARLVWTLVQSGNRGTAADIYRHFRDRLRDNLDLEPSQVTAASVARALNEHVLHPLGHQGRSAAQHSGRRSGSSEPPHRSEPRDARNSPA